MRVVTRHERMLLQLLLVLTLLTHDSLGYLPFRWSQLNFTDCKVRNPSEGDVNSGVCKFSSSGRSMKPKDEWITQISTSYVKSVLVTADHPWYLTLELDGNACRPFVLSPGLFICHEIGSKITVKLDKEEREENKGWILKDVNAIGEKLKEGEVRVRVKNSQVDKAWYYGDCIDPSALGMPPTLKAWLKGPKMFLHFYTVQFKSSIRFKRIGARSTSFAEEVQMLSWYSSKPADLGVLSCGTSEEVANSVSPNTLSANSNWTSCQTVGSPGSYEIDRRSRLHDVECVGLARSVHLKFVTFTENVVFLYEVFVESMQRN